MRFTNRASNVTRGVALGALSAILFVTFLDNTIVSVTLADIQTSLGVGVTGLQWIVDAYMLAFASLMLTGGTLGDLLGRKSVMLGGVAVFCAGSIVAALAPDAGTLIAGRVVMGVGAAASEPGTLSLIRHVYPERQARARALGVWSAVSGLALALGPILGGVIVGGVGWRGVFWFSLAFGAGAFAVAAITLEESSDPQGRRLDLPGLVVSAGTVTAATYAVIAGESSGYGTWWVDLLFAVSAAGAVLFVLVERRSRDPVLRIEFLRSSTFAGANVVAFAANVSVFAVFFFTTLYLQLIAAFSGWQIALQFVSMMAAMVIAGPAAGRWTERVGPRAPMVAGCLLAGGGMLAVDALLSPTVSVASLAWALAITGFGFGLTLVTMTASVLTLVPPERSGMAASTVNTSRELGGVFGVAVLGAIVNAHLTSGLADKLQELGIPANFRQIVITAVTHGGVPPASVAAQNPEAKGHEALVAKVLQAAENAAGQGVHVALLVAAAIVLAGAVVAALTMRDTRRYDGTQLRVR
jgi:EmrB/QacA subfamily drug resistance transporter